MSRLKASMFVLLGTASYGMLSPLVKLGYQNGFTTAEITTSQTIFGALGLWFIILFSVRRLGQPSWKQILSLLASGMVSGSTGIFYYKSLQSLDASFAVILLFQFTWIGLMLEWATERKKPQKHHWLAILAIIIGTLLASSANPSGFSTWTGTGIIFGMLSALTYALFLHFSGRVATDLNPYFRSAVMVTGSALISLLVFSPSFLWNGSLAEGLWFWGLSVAAFGQIIPTIFLMMGIPKIGTGMASILGSIELPVVVVLSVLILHEQVSALQWIGVLFILTGIFLSEKGWFPRKPIQNS